MPADLLAHGRDVLASQPFSGVVGAELDVLEPGSAQLSLPLAPHLLQQDGFVHGGVLAYLADNALTFAGGAALGPAVVTSEYKINYVRPAMGRQLVARASVVHAGRSQAVCRCDVYAVDAAGVEKLCAIAQGTIALMGAPKSE